VLGLVGFDVVVHVVRNLRLFVLCPSRTLSVTKVHSVAKHPDNCINVFSITTSLVRNLSIDSFLNLTAKYGLQLTASFTSPPVCLLLSLVSGGRFSHFRVH